MSVPGSTHPRAPDIADQHHFPSATHAERSSQEDENVALKGRVKHLELLLEKSNSDLEAFREAHYSTQRELQGQIMDLKVRNIELEEFRANVTGASFCNLVTSLALDSSELQELLNLCWDCVDIEAKVQGLREKFIQRRSTTEK